MSFKWEKEFKDRALHRRKEKKIQEKEENCVPAIRVLRSEEKRLSG